MLISFGGHSSDWPLSNSFLPKDWIGLVTGMAGDDAPPLPSKFIPLPPGTYIPDVLNASDVVVGKIGYGTVSEVRLCTYLSIVVD